MLETLADMIVSGECRDGWFKVGLGHPFAICTLKSFPFQGPIARLFC